MKRLPPELTEAGVFEQLMAIAKSPPKRAGGGTKKGDRRAHWEIDKLWKARRKNARARSVKAFHAREAMRPRKYARGSSVVAPHRLQDRFLLAMVPGEWHAARDLLQAIGAPRNSHAMLLSMKARGFVRNEQGAWRMTDSGELEQAKLEMMLKQNHPT